MNLNARAAALCHPIKVFAQRFGVDVHRYAGGALVVDCSQPRRNANELGLLLARICMADLSEVSLDAGSRWPHVTVATDEPVLACLASQYAGWEIKGDGFFAMGSGPMRAAAAREPLFAHIGYRESASHCVGVLETSKLPPASTCEQIAQKCAVAADELTLLAAPTHSAAGTLQIVARSVETALHKLHELRFELSRIVRGEGSAPLPPPAADDLAAIGRTNDAILYGGRVTLYVRGDDESLAAVGPRVPSNASPDYGRPFGEIMMGYNNDFYRIDPLLFSPAEVTLVNVDTGRTHRFGSVNRQVWSKSFAGEHGA